MYQVIFRGEGELNDRNSEQQRVFTKLAEVDVKEGEESIEVDIWAKEWEFGAKDTCTKTRRKQVKDERCDSKIPEHEKVYIGDGNKGRKQ